MNVWGQIITLQNSNNRYLRFPWHADIGISPNALQYQPGDNDPVSKKN